MDNTLSDNQNHQFALQLQKNYTRQALINTVIPNSYMNNLNHRPQNMQLSPRWTMYTHILTITD